MVYGSGVTDGNSGQGLKSQPKYQGWFGSFTSILKILEFAKFDKIDTCIHGHGR